MKKINFIFVILIMISLGLFGIFFFSSKASYGIEEGRMFSLKPNINIFELAKNSTIESLETYYQDHFFFRTLFLEQGTNIKKVLGMTLQNGVYIGKDGYLLEQPTEVKNPNLLIDYINEFYKTYNDLNTSLVLLPSHVTVDPSKAPKNVPIFDEYHQMKSIYHQVTVNTIDVVPVLKKGLDDYDMYYHLDSHMTSYGAYYVYKEYARLNDVTEVPITQFDIEEVTDSFAGNLVKKVYTFSDKKDSIVQFTPKNSPKLEILYPDRKENTLYQKSALQKYMYDYFLGTEIPIIEITNFSIQNQKEILVLKDDSANAMIPFLTNHYYKVHVINTQNYESSIAEYLNNHKAIKDVLFIYYMNGLEKTLENLVV